MKLEGQTAIAGLKGGLVRGTVRDAVCAFRGIPYGERIDSTSRYSDIRPPAWWHGELDATMPGAVFPQRRSRLAVVMGDAISANPQSEDAFVLNVWAPVSGNSLPVFVFIHGGGFMTGGGSAPWYDGERLARDGRFIVVTVNYRLGAFGHCAKEGDPAGANRPVRDLLRALEWVQQNIAQFGGDPADVTVSGQSAGAWYAWLLGVSPAARGMLRRNILFSLPIVPPMNHDEARHTSREFMEQAGGREFDALSTDDILSAQVAVMRSRMAFGEVAVAFRPAFEEGLVPEWLFDFRRAAREAHVGETLVGSTAEESAAFMFIEPPLVGADEATVREWYGRQYADQSARVYAELARRRPGHSPYTQLVDGSSFKMFGAGVEHLCQAFHEAGRAAYPFLFNVQSHVPDLMSPHCLELPLLFGNRQGWSDAPMIARVSDAVFERAGADLRSAVGGFVSDGTPQSAAGEPWQRYSPLASRISEFQDSGVSARRWETGLITPEDFARLP
ncbi:Phenmedipham hydrolase [Cupriavidus yeoncheonensis]|uniref:Carboxylic ester hydrolase n=2 Tax=Cupriavidus yeoncheonensis TaxID=1462994 RepID=A0A916J1T3_9BURK|nr:Phenmedipham hydrolase [Cupriavidus yeoncheonensis]